MAEISLILTTGTRTLNHENIRILHSMTVERSSQYPTPSRSKPIRVSLSTNKQKLALQELNRLFQAAGLPSRSSEKLGVAVKHSLFCVSAKTLKTKKLVGFVRATGDGVFNATVWDLVVDPSLPNQDGLKMLLL
ncbi:MAG: hypothetical protein F6K09_06825, partial [Merismopedia sp. SIO2A8]|nr:hypothetical protein [Merismopedia sp. SIO2A8]